VKSGTIASDSTARSVATKLYLLIIRVNTLNRWEHAETWRTDHYTYPSKNVEDEETLRKRTDVRGNGPNRKPVLVDREHGPGVQLIGISPSGTSRH